MIRIMFAILTLGGVFAVATLSRGMQDATPKAASTAFQIDAQEKNPWTHLKVNAAPDMFQFAIVSDRTGGHRAGVFSRAVEQLNLLQPDFVVSVGDLIEGSSNKATIDTQWEQFNTWVNKLQMPFFYAPGNHDASNLVSASAWNEKYGRRYYQFVYKNALFVILNAFDEDGLDATKAASYKGHRFGPKQQAWLKKTLAENAKVRWTFVFMHPPVWVEKDLEKTGWLEMEKDLAPRKYNVFAGHLHNFKKYFRNGTTYYQLATTGGGSAMRGPEYGEIDQVAWVTMKNETPILAHLNLEGIYQEDFSLPKTVEPGQVNEVIKGLLPVKGKVTWKVDGRPAIGTMVVFHQEGKLPGSGLLAPKAVADGRVMEDGTFTVSQRRGSSGLKPGPYIVTINPSPKLVIDGKPNALVIPEKYLSPKSSSLVVEVVDGRENSFDFSLEQ